MMGSDTLVFEQLHKIPRLDFMRSNFRFEFIGFSLKQFYCKLNAAGWCVNWQVEVKRSTINNNLPSNQLAFYRLAHLVRFLDTYINRNSTFENRQSVRCIGLNRLREPVVHSEIPGVELKEKRVSGRYTAGYFPIHLDNIN